EPGTASLRQEQAEQVEGERLRRRQRERAAEQQRARPARPGKEAGPGLNRPQYTPSRSSTSSSATLASSTMPGSFAAASRSCSLLRREALDEARKSSQLAAREMASELTLSHLPAKTWSIASSASPSMSRTVCGTEPRSSDTCSVRVGCSLWSLLEEPPQENAV